MGLSIVYNFLLVYGLNANLINVLLIALTYILNSILIRFSNVGVADVFVFVLHGRAVLILVLGLRWVFGLILVFVCLLLLVIGIVFIIFGSATFVGGCKLRCLGCVHSRVECRATRVRIVFLHRSDIIISVKIILIFAARALPHSIIPRMHLTCMFNC